jgi:hypothetical protein
MVREFGIVRSALNNRVIPSPLLISGIIELARNSPQNPDVKELRGQNLDNRGLRGSLSWLAPTVTASTMIADLNLGDKVRCHRGIVENVKDETNENGARSVVLPFGSAQGRFLRKSRRVRQPTSLVTCADGDVDSLFMQEIGRFSQGETI